VLVDLGSASDMGNLPGHSVTQLAYALNTA